MTPLQRFLRNVVDRIRKRYYEGPEAPVRLGQEVRLFVLHHPDATIEEWKAFAKRLAENSYRDGFTRGLEWNERLWPGPATEPELLAEMNRHDWSYPEDRLRQQEAAPSPVAGLTAGQAAALQHDLARAGARLVPLETIEPRPGNRYPRRSR